MNEMSAYRTLFTGALVQESFLSLGGTDDPSTTVDSPFCRDGQARPTLRGSSLAGALVSTLRRVLMGTNENVPEYISGSSEGRHSSDWRFFNSHAITTTFTDRQHVAINAKTGAAEEHMLFNVETLSPGTTWPFLLEVVTSSHPDSADLAEQALAHWAAGRCLLGREVARGMGWMRLQNLERYDLTTAHIDTWPNAKEAKDYTGYIAKTFDDCKKTISAPSKPLPCWWEYTLNLRAGVRDDDESKGYGIDSLSIGGHASEELAAAWDKSFLAPDGMDEAAAKNAFDPDFAVVTLEQNGKRIPYIPGSSLRGPLRHALQRLKAQDKHDNTVKSLFGETQNSAKLLIRDAFFVTDSQCELQYAWLQQHAEDEFAGGVYGSGKFDRVAVMQGRFCGKLVIEDATEDDIEAFNMLKELAEQGQIGIGGGQWRGHGWLRWEIK